MKNEMNCLERKKRGNEEVDKNIEQLPNTGCSSKYQQKIDVDAPSLF